MASRFWVGGTGSWDNTTTTHWSSATGGTGGASVPTSADDVFFDANSGAGTVSTTTGLNLIGNIDFTGWTGTLGGGFTISVSGNATLGTTGHGFSTALVLNMRNAGGTLQTLTSNGQTANQLAVGSGTTPGNVKLADGLTLVGALTLTIGTFDPNGQAWSIGSFSSNNSNTRSIVGTSTGTLTSTAATTIWNASASLVLSAGTTIVVGTAATATRTFAGGGLTYALTYTVANSPGSLVITGANTFTALNIGPGRQLVMPSSTANTFNGWGVSGSPNGYLYLPGVSGNTASTPDSPVVSVTGDIDARVEVALDNWAGAAATFFAKVDNFTTLTSYQFEVQPNGFVRFLMSSNGAAWTKIYSATAALSGLVNGSATWVRATRVATTGNCTFYQSSDGIAWTQVGAVVTGPTGNIFASTANLVVGATNAGTGTLAVGKFYRAQIRNNVLDDGTGIVFDADFTTKTVGANTFNESANGATVTINGTLAQVGDGRIAITASTPGTAATLLPSATATLPFSSDYLSLQDIAAISAPSGAISLGGSESSTGADAAGSIGRTISEPGSGADTGSLTATTTTTDAGLGAETPALATAATNPATGAESASLAATLTASDPGTEAETAAITNSLSAADAAVEADLVANALSNTDAGAALSVLAVALPGSEAGVGTDAAALLLAPSAAETGTEAETYGFGVGTVEPGRSLPGYFMVGQVGSPFAMLGAVEFGSPAYTGLPTGAAIALSTTGASTGSDSGIPNVAGSDAGVESDSGVTTTNVTTSDASTEGDVVSLALLTTDAESGATTTAITATSSASDALTGTDTPSLTVPGTESGASATAAAVNVLVTETGVESDSFSNALATTEAGAQGQTLGVAFSTTDSAVEAESPTVGEAHSASDAGVEADTGTLGVATAETGAAGQTLAVALATTDTETATDQPVLSATGTDSAALVASVAVSLTASDRNTNSSSVVLSGLVGGPYALPGLFGIGAPGSAQRTVELASVSMVYLATDSAAEGDVYAISTRANDSTAGADTFVLTAAPTAADTGISGEFMTFFPVSEDDLTGYEAVIGVNLVHLAGASGSDDGRIAAAVQSSDLASDADSVAVGPQVGDRGQAQTEARIALGTVDIGTTDSTYRVALASSDPVHGDETPTLALTATDGEHGTDVVALNQAHTTSDSGVSDAAARIALSAHDDEHASEVEVIDLRGLDSGNNTDGGSIGTTASDHLSLHELASLLNLVFGTDSGTDRDDLIVGRTGTDLLSGSDLGRNMGLALADHAVLVDAPSISRYHLFIHTLHTRSWFAPVVAVALSCTSALVVRIQAAPVAEINTGVRAVSTVRASSASAFRLTLSSQVD